MPTMREVADLAQVSTSTVSHVINQTRQVNPETRERVLRAMEQLNYRPNRLARSLRRSQTHTLGVLLPNSANPFFAEVLLGIEAACFDLGYNVILGNANDDPKRELFYLDVLLSKQVDGILLVSTGAYREAVELIARYNAPVVMVDRSPGTTPAEFPLDMVFTDNEQGGVLAGEYLLKLGHGRIGCIAGPSLLTPSAHRLTGYRRALESAGVAVRDSLIVSGDFQHESGYRACQQLLALAEPPTAIFVCNDLMAIGALCAIHEAGLRVPADISVIGFDNIPLSAYTVPRLTTIAQPAEQLGRVAVGKLIARLQNRASPTGYERLPVSLIERDSCGPVPGRKQ